MLVLSMKNEEDDALLQKHLLVNTADGNFKLRLLDDVSGEVDRSISHENINKIQTKLTEL